MDYHPWEDEYFGGGTNINKVLNDPAWYNHLMQFIGLKDKNEQEIYEGDVVKYDDSGETGYVDYSTEHTNYIVDDWKKGQTESSGYTISELGILEIIGNIYENPELLKKEIEQ